MELAGVEQKMHTEIVSNVHGQISHNWPQS